MNIGLIFSQMRERYTASLWPVVLETARNEGVGVVLFPETQNRVCQGYAKTLDALLILTGDISLYHPGPALEKFLFRFSALPKVHLSMEIPPDPCYGIDNSHAVRDSVRHLVLDHGVRDIAYIRGPQEHQEAQIRFSAYRAALEELGIAYREDWVYQGNFFKESGPAALKAFLDERHLPLKAVLSANDAMALAFIEAAFERGLSVPEDLMVIGFDDTEGAQAGRVSLTTVRQPYRQLAEAATLAVIDLARGKAPGQARSFLPSLIIRNSCGCYSESVRAIVTEALAEPSSSDGLEARAAWRSKLSSALLGSLARSRLPVETREFLAAGLVEAFEGIEDSDKGFLELLADALYREIGAQGRPSLWHGALSVLNAHPGPFLGQAWFSRAAALQKARVLVEESRSALAFRESVQQYFNHLNAERLVSRILLDLSRERLSSVLLEELPKAGIRSAFASLYDKPLNYELDGEALAERRLSCLFAYDLTDPAFSPISAQGNRPGDPSYPAGLLYPPGFRKPGERRDYVIMPLHHADEEYGVIVQEVGEPRDGTRFDTIGQQVSAVFKRVLIEEERSSAVVELKSTLDSLNLANEKLYGLSRVDELTGLLNRRGFMEAAGQNLSLAARMGSDCALFFMDLDGLKRINDTYGHQAGDKALSSLSDILRHVFRATDTLCRLGGDEFIAFSLIGPAALPMVQSRLDEAISAFNKSSGYPWELSLSVGHAFSTPATHLGLDELLKEADIEAYRVKLKKKSGR